MDEHRAATTSGFAVTPDSVAGRNFTTTFRGFDQGEVRAFLKKLSEELAAAAGREANLRRQLVDAENRAAHPELDEEALTHALGEQAARLLATAREQAASIRGEVEARAGRMMRDAEAQIARVRSEADSLLARRVEEVDGVTANLRHAAEADARALREQVKADCEAELQAARNQGREMVAEARAARERILADLARRRHVAEVQLDQLRAARERLLSAYALVRRTLDEATQELKMAEVEARLAAEEAARRAPEPPPVPADVLARREERTPPSGTPAVRTGTATVAAATAGAAAASASASAASTSAADAGAPTAAPAAPGRARSAAPGAAGSTAPGAAGSTAPGNAGTPVGTATAVRTPGRTPSRFEPLRTEPRLRPPSRPGDSRPGETRPGPGRRPSELETARATPPSPPHRSPAGVGRAGGPPTPPSILPRPVPPPPSRRGAVAPSSLEPEGRARSTPGPDRVDELFARIKADRAAVAAQAGPSPLVEAPADPSAPDASSAPAVTAPGVTAPPRPSAPATGGLLDTEPSDVAAPPAPAAEPLSMKANAPADVPAESATGAAPESDAPRGEPPAGEAGSSEARGGEAATSAAATGGEAASGDRSAPADRPSRGAIEIADEQARLRRDELLDPVDEALARQLKRVLQDEQNEVLDRMRRRRRRHRESPLLSADEHAGRYREAAETVLGDAMRAGARFADSGDRGGHVDFHGRAVREAAEALARELAQPLRQRLERALADSSGDADAPDAAESLSLVYRQWRSQELEPLARHYAVLAFSRGAYGAYADAAPLRWVVDDAAPCPDCDDNALAGAVLKGQAYPTGQLHPPAHPGCRCLLVPAVP